MKSKILLDTNIWVYLYAQNPLPSATFQQSPLLEMAKNQESLTTAPPHR